MRPLRLCMTGFGPYKNETVIDMASLGTGGLYLITGDTGAGKTFIFDAITYALYGDMSGSGRDARTARSQYSDAGEVTKVELDFEYRGKVYNVVRNPEYIRSKKRGEGTAVETAGATLTLPGGSVVDGTSKVTEEIKSILGIDRAQFRSIAMIAQGEFRELLDSSTDERIRLFRNLFETEPYERLTAALAGMAKEVRDKYEQRSNDLRSVMDTIDCGFDDGFAERLETLKAGPSPAIQDVIAFLEEATETANRISKETAKELESVEKELSDAGKRLALIDQYKENTESLEKAKNSIPGLIEQIKTAEKALDEAGAIRKEIEKLGSEASLIKGSIDSYDDLDAINEELLDHDRSLEEKNERLEKVNMDKTGEESRYSELLSEKEDIRYSGEKLAKLKIDIEKASNRITILKSLTADIEKVKILEAELNTEQEELKPLIDKADETENKLTEMRSAYMKEQAGILACDLEEGKPCPVCGSVHHPDPAGLSEEAPTASEIEEWEEKAKEARKIASNKSDQANKIKGSLNAASFSAAKTALRETGTDDLDEAAAAAEEDSEKLKDDVASYEKTAKELEIKSKRNEEIDAEIEAVKRHIDDLGSEAGDLSKEIAGLEASAKGAMQRKTDIKKFLLFDSRSEAENRLDEISSEIESRNEEITKRSSKHSEAVLAKQSNDAAIEELERVIKGFRQDDEEAAREAGYNAEQMKKRLGEDVIRNASCLRSCEYALSKIREIEDDLEKIRSEHEMIDSLSRTASGSLAGKDRISLETYVQTYYFDRVIKRANRRLYMISGGQYEFARSSESRDKRSHNGLDLEVVDHYGGSRRPVSTLSGGESFVASLSLALGLSDEVQASAGGIRLDTMFVDEGFGSLDSETLELAVRTLTELSGDDLLVGIISHVEALKTRIDKQIIVTKDRGEGSTARVLTL